jgi:hypothetical protein
VALMALPEMDVARVQRWCIERTPPEFRHEMVVECEVAVGRSRFRVDHARSRPVALLRGVGDLDALLAGPERTLSCVQPAAAVPTRPGLAERDRA